VLPIGDMRFARTRFALSTMTLLKSATYAQIALMGHTKFVTNRTYKLHKLILLGNVSRVCLRNKVKIGRFIVQKHFLYLKKYIMEILKYIKILIYIY